MTLPPEPLEAQPVSPSALSDLSADQWVDSLTKVLKIHTPNGEGRPKKLKSLDDIANVDPAAGGSPKAVKLTSPRSLLACLQTGIDPREIVYRPFEEFAEKGLTPELQKLKYEHCEAKRQEKLQRLQLERQKIMEKDHEVGGDSGALGGLRLPGSPGSPLREEGKKSPQSPSILNALGGADMVEKEARRLEVLQRRQQRELEQMINYEKKRQMLAAEAQRIIDAEREAQMREMVSEDAQTRIQEEKNRQEAEKQERLRREREWQEEQRLKEVEKAKRDEEAERRSRALAAERYKQDMEAATTEKEKQRLRQKEAAEREQERLRKQEEFRLQTEKIQEEHQKAIQKRQAEMDEKDRQRQMLLEQQRQEKAIANAEARMKAAERLQSALETGRSIMQKKRDDYNAKQREVAEKQKVKEERWRQEEAIRKQKEKQKEQQRQLVFQEAMSDQEKRIHNLVSKASEADQILETVQRQKKDEMARRALERQLKAEEKREKAEQMKRMQAFHRAQMLQRIEDDTARARALLEARTHLQQRRKDANVEASLQRQQLLMQMEKLQITKKWSKLSDGAPDSPGGDHIPQRASNRSPEKGPSQRTGAASVSPLRQSRTRAA